MEEAIVRGARAVAGAALALFLAGVGSAGAQTADSLERRDAAQARAGAETPKKLNPFTGDSAAITEGKALWFKYNCYGCHGTGGGGGMGSSMIDTHWIYGGDDATVFDVTRNGRGRMPAVGQLANMSDEEIWKVIAYLRSHYVGDPKMIVW